MTIPTTTSITSSTATSSQRPITTASPVPMAHYTTSSNLSAAILNRQETSVDIPKLNEHRSVGVISPNESEFSNLSERTLPPSDPDSNDGCFDKSSDEDSIEMQRGIILFQIMTIGRGQTHGVIDLGEDDFDRLPRTRPCSNSPPTEEKKKNPTSSRSNSTDNSSHIAPTNSFSSFSSMSANSAIPNDISKADTLEEEEDLLNSVRRFMQKMANSIKF